MPRLHSLLLSIGLVALLSGCQFQLPGTKGPDDVTPNAVAGDAIEVTALDTPAPVAPVEAAQPPAADPAADGNCGENTENGGPGGRRAPRAAAHG